MSGLNTINEAIEDTVLGKLLGTNGVDELKSRLIDTIVEEVRSQLHGSYEYIISPDYMCEILQDEVVDKVIDEIKEEYKNCIKEAANKKLNGLLDL